MDITQIRNTTSTNTAEQLKRSLAITKKLETTNKPAITKNTATTNNQDALILAHRKKQLEEVGMSFEKILINKMLTSMRNSVDKKSDLLYGGMSQDIFEDMLYEKYAENMAQSKVLGFAQTIVSQYEKYL